MDKITLPNHLQFEPRNDGWHSFSESTDAPDMMAPYMAGTSSWSMPTVSFCYLWSSSSCLCLQFCDWFSGSNWVKKIFSSIKQWNHFVLVWILLVLSSNSMSVDNCIIFSLGLSEESKLNIDFTSWIKSNIKFQLSEGPFCNLQTD